MDTLFLDNPLDQVLRNSKIVSKGIKTPNAFVSANEAYALFINNLDNGLKEVANNPHLVEVVKHDGEFYLEQKVGDDALGYLANADGLISVGNRVLKVERQELIFVSRQDYAEYGLESFQSSESKESYPIFKDSQEIEKRNWIAPERVEFNGSGSRRNRRKTFRLTGNLESTDSFIGPNRVIVRAKFFRRRFGIWWGTQGNLTIRWSLSGRYTGNTGVCCFSRASVGPITERRQNFPEEVASDADFVGGSSGTWIIDSGGFFAAAAEENGGQGSILMLP